MKIVISDMDGTLLNNNKEMDKDFKGLINILHDKDVMIGIASGRQYEILKRDFMGYEDKMVFIADNGSLTVIDGEIVDKNVLDREDVLRITKYLDEYKNLEYILCAINASYLNTNDDVVLRNAMMYCHKLKTYNSVEEVLENDEIVKIAVYDKEKDIKHKIKDFEHFKDRVNVIMSAIDWMDFMCLNVSKGEALKRIKAKYNLSDKDCVVFGDYDNDIDILKEAYYSYAMKNATQSVKDVANFECLSNEECGVSRKIIELFEL